MVVVVVVMVAVVVVVVVVVVASLCAHQLDDTIQTACLMDMGFFGRQKNKLLVMMLLLLLMMMMMMMIDNVVIDHHTARAIHAADAAPRRAMGERAVFRRWCGSNSRLLPRQCC